MLGQKVLPPLLPVLWFIRKLLTTITTYVEGSYAIWSLRGLLLMRTDTGRRKCSGGKEGSGGIIGQDSTRPGAGPTVNGILMAFGLVLIFEFIMTIDTLVLFLTLMLTAKQIRLDLP